MRACKSFVLLMVVALLVRAAPCRGAAGSLKDVEPTDWGSAKGRVYDADTGSPIEGVAVTAQQDGTFAANGRTVSTTNGSGQYRCEARLGRVRSRVEVGRLLATGLIGLLSGAAERVSRRVDVTQVNLRVTKEGYHPFEGPVPCNTIDANAFTIFMEPILLTRADQAEASTVAKGWTALRILEVTADPTILRPGSCTAISVRLKCPAIAKRDEIVVQCEVVGLAKMRLDYAKDQPASDSLLFSGRLCVPDSAKAGAHRLSVSARAPYDLGSDERAGPLICVVTDFDERKAARLRTRADDLAGSGNNVEARAELQELCALPQATADDFQALADVSLRLHDYEGAVASMKRVVEQTPEKTRFVPMAQYANALVLGGQGNAVIQELTPVVDKVKEQDRPKRMPADLMVAIGTAYLNSGKLTEAVAIERQLARWPDSGSRESVREFRRSLRLVQVEAAAKADPKSAAAWADYGRALMDLGRWEEAAENLRKAVSLDSQTPAVQWDLGYALLQMSGGSAEASQSFEQALADAERAVQVAKDKPKTKDFFAWHRLGILLYRKACAQRAAGDAGSADTLTRSQEMLIEALKCAHAGAQVSQGQYSYTFGYTSPAVIAVAGFAYPEASADFSLLNALAAAGDHPVDYLAQFNEATALIDLGQWDLASDALQKAVALKPDFVEAKYAAAIIATKTGRSQEAVRLLQEVLAANPRHPDANPALAKLYTEQGDMSAAASCLAAHAGYYGPGVKAAAGG